MAAKRREHPAVAAVRRSGSGKVKVAVADIDGVLRGKYLHRDKFLGAVESGFGFCDVVLGWDSGDACYDNTRLTGWHHGFPDATARVNALVSGQVDAIGRVAPTAIVPSCISTSRLAMASPSPRPPNCRVMVRPPCSNASNILSAASGSTPMPESLTLMRTCPASRLQRSLTYPPSGVNLTALVSRFQTTC